MVPWGWEAQSSREDHRQATSPRPLLPRGHILRDVTSLGVKPKFSRNKAIAQGVCAVGEVSLLYSAAPLPPLTPLESASQTYSRALSEQLAPFTKHKTPGLFQSFLAIAPGSKPAGRGQTGTRGRPEPWLASDLVNLDQNVGFLRCWGGAMPSWWELGHPAVTYLHMVLPLLQFYYENPLKETNYFK